LTKVDKTQLITKRNDGQVQVVNLLTTVQWLTIFGIHVAQVELQVYDHCTLSTTNVLSVKARGYVAYVFYFLKDTFVR